MGLFDFLNFKKEPESKAYKPTIQPEPKKYADDCIKPEDIYCPDIPKYEPAIVPHIALTYEEAIEKGWHFKRKSRMNIRISRYTGTNKNIVIPAEIDGRIVNELGKNAFSYTEIESATLPCTLRKIGEGCFRSSKLHCAVFENGIKCVPSRMFLNCDHLEYVRFSEHLQNIGVRAFDGCQSLKYISIINSRIVTIGDLAFANSGLEGYAMLSVTYLRVNGTIFSNTPMQKNYKLILSPEQADEGEYKVLLFGRDAEVKFPKGSSVSLKEGSVAAGCALDLSECGSISINDKAIPYERYPNGVTRMYTPCSLILPQGHKDSWFPKTTKATYPDGSRYDGYLKIENPDADTAVLTLYSYILHSYTVNCKARNIIFCKSNSWMKFEEHAVSSRYVEHIVLGPILVCEGELFSSGCVALHCVEWKGKIVYIPPVELVGYRVQGELLKAFHGHTINWTLYIYDESVPKRIFTDENKKTRLSQRQKILLAVDVLRSTGSLFTDRTI